MGAKVFGAEIQGAEVLSSRLYFSPSYQQFLRKGHFIRLSTVTFPSLKDKRGKLESGFVEFQALLA